MHITRPPSATWSGAWPFLWRCAARRRFHVGGAIAAVTVGAACAVAAQWTLKTLIDAMVLGDRHVVEVALAIFLALTGAEAGSWRFGGWAGSRAVVRVGADIRLMLFDHLTAQSPRFFGARPAGALANRIPAAADATRALLSTLIWNIVPPLADFAGALLVIASIAWPFALALAASGLVAATVTLVLGRAAMPAHRALYAEAAQTAGDIVDVIGNVALLKAFGTRRRERARLAGRIRAESRAHIYSWSWLETTRALNDVLLWLATSGVLVMAVHAWGNHALTTGGVVVVTTLTFRVLNSARELALSALGLSQHYGAVVEAVNVLASPLDIADAAGARPIAIGAGAIQFRRVGFTFVEGRSVLRDFSLNIAAGQRVGIVGASGAGKSTLLRLLQRHEEPQTGDILIDDQRVDSVTQQSLAESIAVVTQEIALFHRSIAENIRYGRPGATDAEVERAAEMAHCAGFIAAMPQGYATLVGERGTALSGGQRQRIAIARAILKDAKIILFDEATSALDAESEIAVQLAMTQLMRGRTVLAVAHRLSTILDFDRVVVLEQGRIVEDGPPQHLVRGTGPFSRAWRLHVGDGRQEMLRAAA